MLRVFSGFIQSIGGTMKRKNIIKELEDRIDTLSLYIDEERTDLRLAKTKEKKNEYRINIIKFQCAKDELIHVWSKLSVN